MKIAVSPDQASDFAVLRCALSSRRSEVVPTATMRPPRALHRVQRRRGLRRNDATLGMHLVVCRIVGLDRQKRARTDMQRDEMPFDAGLRPARQKARA